MKLVKILICVGLLSINVMGDIAFSKMAANLSVTATVNEIRVYFNTEMNKRKLSSDETAVFQLVNVAHEVFKINDFVVDGHTQQFGKEKALRVHTIAKAIQNSLKININFDKPISTADLAKVKEVEELIKKNLGADSFALAWLNYKSGNKALAKTQLNRSFDRAYDEAMKLKQIGFFHGENPIQDVEDFSTALTPISTEAENKERGARLKKMQVHASNLPQIMT